MALFTSVQRIEFLTETHLFWNLFPTTWRLIILIGKFKLCSTSAKWLFGFLLLKRSASDTIVGVRSATRNWFDLLVINGFDFSPMRFEFDFGSIKKNSSSFQRRKSKKYYQWHVSLEETNPKRLPFFLQFKQTNHSLSLCYTSPVWLFNEVDGVRIISGKNLDFLQRLPDQIYNVLSLTSDAPGAKLYSAYTRYKVKSFESLIKEKKRLCSSIFQDESQYGEIFLDELKSSQSKRTLEDAVKQCLLAASLENESAIQKILLKVSLQEISVETGRKFLSSIRQRYLAVHFYISILKRRSSITSINFLPI